MKQLKELITTLLEDNILHYWLTQMVDNKHGGFYGRRDGNDPSLIKELFLMLVFCGLFRQLTAY